MANLTGSSGSQEFAGDEFSNNLVSDLAPLLALFVYHSAFQKNMYYGSPILGMGWADNILLAMGPLGIMTIIVSAIRVGRAKILKAIVGRARESKYDTEQELLSSTSEDLCELWNGLEIVRVLGQPAGMKTLIIADKNVHDIKSAMRYGLIRDDSDLDPDYLDYLTNAAPNLALNVRNATASSWELWTWAAVGTILQVTAIVIPGIATYIWQWPKADIKVQAYGYPCFVIGTTLVVLGTMGCGHVIEGVTTEHKFTKERRHGVQILQLQRACTVGDQHFSSYAIFNDENNHSIRTSRLNATDYSTLGAVSSLASVVGFIIQFVGLRALHWSATLLQLSITIIMTGIRAWARRGLAFDPVPHVAFDGHEIAWLALQVFSKKLQETSVASSTTSQRNLEMDLTPFWDIPFQQGFQGADDIIWEPIMGYDSYQLRAMRLLGGLTVIERASQAFDKNGIAERDLYMFQQFFTPLRINGSVGVELTTGQPHKLLQHDALTPLKQCQQITAVMPPDNAVKSAASALTSVLDRVMHILCDAKAIRWKEKGVLIPQMNAEQSDSEEIGANVPDELEENDLEVFWGFTISMRLPSESQMQASSLHFSMKRVVNETPSPDSGPDRWLQDREKLIGVLTLWLYSMARRRNSIDNFNISLTKAEVWRYSDVKFGRFGRIVGTGSLKGGGKASHPLSQWLGIAIREIALPNGANIDPEKTREGPTAEMTWFLGMFLSSIAETDETRSSPEEARKYEEGGVLVIQTREDSSLEMLFAQELFSLFILAMANNISQVFGNTIRHSRKDDMTRNLFKPSISLENSVFSAIANEVVNGGLAHDMTEAYSLIIPAFHKLDLLPSPMMEN